MTSKCVNILIVLIYFFSEYSFAVVCNIQHCDGYPLPVAARDFVSKGYSDIRIDTLKNERFLFLSNENDVNKCFVLFGVNDSGIKKEPIIGPSDNFCNPSQVGGNVTSSWRDQGIWNNDVYQVNSDGGLTLLLRDSCSDCEQVKRTYFKNGQGVKKVLLSGGDNYLSRKKIEGYVKASKVYLYKHPDEREKTRAYLVKGDAFLLIDMSDDGLFYEMDYKTPLGRSSQYWIKSDDFELKN